MAAPVKQTDGGKKSGKKSLMDAVGNLDSEEIVTPKKKVHATDKKQQTSESWSIERKQQEFKYLDTLQSTVDFVN